MTIKILSTFVAIGFFAFSLSAKPYYAYSDLARSTYQKIFDLRFEEAEKSILRLQQQEPQNLVVHQLENYLDFFKVFIDEDEQQFERLEQKKSARLSAIAQGSSSSPYYLFLQADVRLHLAIIHMKFQNYTKAAWEINQAFKLLKKNLRQHPNFLYTKKDLGFLYAFASSMPGISTLEWISSLEGDYKKGVRMLNEVITSSQNSDFIFKDEAYILLSYTQLKIGKDKTAAWQTISKSSLSCSTSPTATFVKASIALECQQNDRAIQLLSNRPQSNAFHPFPYLDFLLGKAKLQQLDAGAGTYFLKFLFAYKGQSHIKDAYRRLAWHELIQGNAAGYTKYIQQVATNGNVRSGSDESALKEAQENHRPAVAILKARLLLDGGYYEKAYQLLKQERLSNFQQQKDRVEYTYFLGRIAQELQHYEEALQQYQQTIQIGRYTPWYYACRAALEMGNIHLLLNQKASARSAFQTCLSITPEAHRFSLHQQAKAGLEQL